MTAWTEIMVASRTDSYLRETVSAASDRAAEFISQSFKELFPRPEGAGDYYDVIPNMVMTLLTGNGAPGAHAQPRAYDKNPDRTENLQAVAARQAASSVDALVDHRVLTLFILLDLGRRRRHRYRDLADCAGEFVVAFLVILGYRSAQVFADVLGFVG